MTRTVNLLSCDVDALADAFEAHRTAIVPSLDSCSAADLLRAIRAAAPVVREVRMVAEVVAMHAEARAIRAAAARVRRTVRANMRASSSAR